MSRDLIAEDDVSRRRALDIDSFIVEAPAGAGKTELLTQRFLRLLAEVDEPEEIVAITFTNKAAGEMRQRIGESLERARRGEVPEPAHKRITHDLARAALARAAQRGWDIASQPGRLRLTTIDALCAALSRQMPLLSRFGAQPAPVEDAGRHYREAARRALAHLEDGPDGAAHADAVAAALAWMDNDAERLVLLLSAMLARREQWRGLAALTDPEAAVGMALEDLVLEELARVASGLDAGWQGPWMPLARFAAAQRGGGELAGWDAPLGATVDDLPRWRALAGFLLTDGDDARRRVDVRHGFPAGKEFKARKDAMQQALAALDEDRVERLARVRRLPTPTHEDDRIVRALATLMRLAAAELWLVFRDAGEIDFPELAMRAIAALGEESDPTELGLRLDWRIRHLLVDEFQDTSPAQVELLERLTAGWQPGDRRTLFCVGDPMQSIYRFRKAEVGLFLRARERGIGGLALTPLRLSRNNRACAPVVDWVNAGFPALFPPRDEPVRGEIAYRRFIATREDLPDAGVTMHALLTERGGRDDAARLEAETVVAIIEAEWRADPQRRIAVLVRARDHLAALVAAIRRHPAGWRHAAVDIEPLAGRQAVQDLISLACALHHRGDRLHWLAILRAPWCGLRLADLHALAGDDREASIWSLLQDETRLERLSADGQARARGIREVLDVALSRQGRTGRRRWVEDCWTALGGPSCLVDGGGRADPMALADARAFFSRLDELDAGGRFSVDSLEDDMGRLFAAPDAEADGRLQLMTLHKAKGLEFDTVILPGLHRGTPPPEPALLAWDSFPLAGGERLVVAPVNRRRRGGSEATAYDFLQRLEGERADSEASRVLYVGVTRAVRRLHLVAVGTRRDDGRPAPPPANSLLAKLWPLVEADFAAAQVHEDVRAEGAARGFIPRLWRKTDAAYPVVRSAEPETLAFPREETADPMAADVGTLVHTLLELAAEAPADWTAASLPPRVPGLVRWLAARGWSEAEAREGAARAAHMLATTLDSIDGRWVLHTRAEAGAEMAIATTGADGVTETRVVDRSFVEDGVRWIVDYKTSDLGAAADATRLATHAERYRPQLEAYGRLFAAEGLPVRLAILYVAHGKLISLDYNQASN